MGVVYEAEDTKLGPQIALKFLPEDKRRDHKRWSVSARSASRIIG